MRKAILHVIASLRLLAYDSRKEEKWRHASLATFTTSKHCMDSFTAKNSAYEEVKQQIVGATCRSKLLY